MSIFPTNLPDDQPERLYTETDAVISTLDGLNWTIQPDFRSVEDQQKPLSFYHRRLPASVNESEGDLIQEGPGTRYVPIDRWELDPKSPGLSQLSDCDSESIVVQNGRARWNWFPMKKDDPSVPDASIPHRKDGMSYAELNPTDLEKLITRYAADLPELACHSAATGALHDPHLLQQIDDDVTTYLTSCVVGMPRRTSLGHTQISSEVPHTVHREVDGITRAVHDFRSAISNSVEPAFQTVAVPIGIKEFPERGLLEVFDSRKQYLVRDIYLLNSHSDELTKYDGPTRHSIMERIDDANRNHAVYVLEKISEKGGLPPKEEWTFQEWQEDELKARNDDELRVVPYDVNDRQQTALTSKETQDLITKYWLQGNVRYI
ncbi:uncharacterized protein L199_002653 [Kwoniella botswanensis]|uniref:uncharacterized protein n=1 Tax=Kwoniella botswanensis TaxID=1268659 RepID=UPI00315D2073